MDEYRTQGDVAAYIACSMRDERDYEEFPGRTWYCFDSAERCWWQMHRTEGGDSGEDYARSRISRARFAGMVINAIGYYENCFPDGYSADDFRGVIELLEVHLDLLHRNHYLQALPIITEPSSYPTHESFMVGQAQERAIIEEHFAQKKSTEQKQGEAT